MPFVMLAESGASSFDISAVLNNLKTVVLWGFDLIKAEPIMSLGFVGGIAVSQFSKVGRTLRGLSR